MFGIFVSHLGEAPIFSLTPLPLLPPKVGMSEADAPNPSQSDDDPRSNGVAFGSRVQSIEMRHEKR